MMDGIVDRPLILCVFMVERCAQVNQLLNSASVAFSCRIVKARLSVLVLPIDGVTALVAEEIDRLGVAFSRGVEKRGLLEGILLNRVHAELDENLDHSESKVFVGDDSGVENRCLTEIFGLIEDEFHIN